MRLHNSLTGQIEDFVPQNPKNVTLYTCGPTVYSEPQLGNWVAYIRWDLLVRTLRANELSVERVMNITDVGHLTSDADEGEDKMTKGARAQGITEWEVAERYTNRFLEGMTVLDLLPPEHMTKATEHIAIQIELVQDLVKKGHAYVLGDGVYFDTATFPNYAHFAHLNLVAQKAGARIDFNTDKRNSSDFVLWRLTPAGETRAMEWDSPWGKGIPGWHIECSAMALHYLGETLDIHTGGIDHIPVHHTNEIAQSEASTGKRFANYWLHANFLQIEGTKLSKSLGNSYTLDDVRTHGFSALDFKLFVLQSHYRSESNFTWDNLAAAAIRLKHWRAIAALRHQARNSPDDISLDLPVAERIQTARSLILEALGKDLNSPLAITHFESELDLIEQDSLDEIRASTLSEFFGYIDDLFGLKLLATTPDIDVAMKQLIADREQARSAKDWKRSDKLREQLTAQGVGLNDTVTGSRWYFL